MLVVWWERTRGRHSPEPPDPALSPSGCNRCDFPLSASVNYQQRNAGNALPASTPVEHPLVHGGSRGSKPHSTFFFSIHLIVHTHTLTNKCKQWHVSLKCRVICLQYIYASRYFTQSIFYCSEYCFFSSISSSPPEVRVHWFMDASFWLVVSMELPVSCDLSGPLFSRSHASGHSESLPPSAFVPLERFGEERKPSV